MKLLNFLLLIYSLIIPLHAARSSDVSQNSTLADVSYSTQMEQLRGERQEKDDNSIDGNKETNDNKVNIYNSRKMLDKFQSEPITIARKFIKEQTRLVIEQLEELMELMRKPQEEAKIKEIDVSECIDDKMILLAGFTGMTLGAIGICAEDKARDLEDIFKDKRDEFNQLSYRINSIMMDVDDCEAESGETKYFCYTILKRKLDVIRTDINEQINIINGDVLEIMSNFEPYFLQHCYHSRVFASEGEMMLKDVFSCLKLKFPQINSHLERRSSNASSRRGYFILNIVNIVYALLLTVFK